MEIKLSKELIDLCKARMLTLDEFCFLLSRFLDKTWNLEISEKNEAKLSALGLYDPRIKYPTKEGVTLLRSLTEDNVPVRIEKYTPEFEKFWSAYPINDGHSVYASTRKIRSRKVEAFTEYNRLIDEGVTPEQILDKLTSTVQELKSLSRVENKLKYMKGPVNFLKGLEIEDEPHDEEDFYHYGSDLA